MKKNQRHNCYCLLMVQATGAQQRNNRKRKKKKVRGNDLNSAIINKLKQQAIPSTRNS